ncbi:MAG: hypothetical protein HKN26_13590 [Acidimicrobiales bacterium]|nr:hypothetical protein [Acidimicrobiales bacterium]
MPQSSFPHLIAPMKATNGELPTGPGWQHELKWDGMRLLVHIHDGELTLRSSNQLDVTVRFPELAGLADAFGGRDIVLDGEAVALDETGRPDFAVLQQRMHISDPVEAQRRSVVIPAALQIFDLLYFDGHDLMGLPLADRRRTLEALVEDGPAWRVTTAHDDGAPLLALADEQDLEGVVSKKLDSLYRPGSRSSAWRKVKIRRHQEFVVGGWAAGEGQRRGRLGSLLVGYYDDRGGLRYAGRVGSGFSQAELRRLLDRLQPHERVTSPFAEELPRADLVGATFVDPVMVVEVAYAEWSPIGRLRHPSYLGERIDADPSAVTSEI